MLPHPRLRCAYIINLIPTPPTNYSHTHTPDVNLSLTMFLSKPLRGLRMAKIVSDRRVSAPAAVINNNEHEKSLPWGRCVESTCFTRRRKLFICFCVSHSRQKSLSLQNIIFSREASAKRNIETFFTLHTLQHFTSTRRIEIYEWAIVAKFNSFALFLAHTSTARELHMKRN